MPVHSLALAIGFGIITASILALSAIALSLQYSVTGIPNFAHGQLLALGAYAALVVQRFVDNVFLEAAAACVVGAIVAWLLNLLLIQPMVRRGAAIVALFVVTLAAAFALDGVILLMFTGTTYAYNLPPDQVVYVGPFQFTYRSLVIIGVSLLVMLVLHVILNYTRFGKAQRAVADSRELARVSGINADGVIRRTWLLAGAVAGFAGFVLAASTGSFAPNIGTNFMLVTFAAAIVGGLGKPYGAVIGALVIGLSMEVSAIYLPANYKDSIAFAVLILTLLFLPNGILATTRENLATQ